MELEVIDNIDKVMEAQKESGKWTTDILMTHSGNMPSYIENGFVQPIDDVIAEMDTTVLEAFQQCHRIRRRDILYPHRSRCISAYSK